MATKKTSAKSARKSPTPKKKAAKKTSSTPAAKKAKPAAKKASKSATNKSPKPVAGMPGIGQLAPAFVATNDLGKKIALRDFAGKNVVLYFYPKDDTPGCTIEACNFRDDMDDLRSLSAVILGVSPDDVDSHLKFKKKFSLNFDLLADTDHSLCQSYGVWVEKNMYGKKYMGVQRATFLIDGSGKIAAVWPKVKVEGHAAEVAEALAKLG